MKFLYALLVAIMLSSCSSREPFFEMNAETEFQISLGLSLIETHNFVRPNVIFPLNSSIQNLGLSELEVTEVVPFTARIQPKFQDEVNLDFINSVNIYIIDQQNLRRRELFYAENIPFGQKQDIELIPTLIDIIPYVENDQALIEVSIELRQFPPLTFDMDVFMSFGGFVSE